MKKTLLALGVIAISSTLAGCYDGVSCDMDPEQSGCPQPTYVPVTPTPTPSMRVLVVGTNAQAWAGMNARVIVTDGYQPGIVATFCAHGAVSTAGTFSFESPNAILALGAQYYSLYATIDTNGDGQVGDGEPDVYFDFDAPIVPGYADARIPLDFAAHPHELAMDWPTGVTCPVGESD